MDTLEAISLRRTIRNFKVKPISDDTLFQILEAGRLAPKAGNIGAIRFVIVTDKGKKEEIAKLAAEQAWLKDAHALVVICSLTNRMVAAYGKRGKMYAIQSTAAAAENMLIAATGLNIGSAWVGAFAEKTLRRILDIPDEADSHAIIALGYPERKPKYAPPQMELAAITYFESWGAKKARKLLSPYPLGEKLKSVLGRK